MKPSWLTVKNEADTGAAEILIHGVIGSSWFDDSGVSEKQFLNELKEIPKGRKIIVGINSEGGSVKDGIGIYNALNQRREDVTCRVDGYAVSIASIIALAGSKTVSPKSSIWMIHEPWSLTQGNADDHMRAADMLEEHAEMMVGIYADETGQTPDKVRKAMRAETWLRGEQAVEWGLADELSDAAVALNKLDLTKFKNPPNDLLASLVAGQGGDTPSQQTQTRTRDKVMSDQNKTVVAVAPEPPAVDDAMQKKLADAEARLETERKKRITAEVDSLISEGRPLAGERDNIITLAMGDEKALNVFRAVPIPDPHASTQTVTSPAAEVVGDAYDQYQKMTVGGDRRKYATYAWHDIRKNAFRRQKGDVQAVNTISADLTTDMLNDTVTTVLQDRLCAIRAFALEVLPDPIKPDATIQLPKVTTAATAQTNPTDWESGNTVIAATSITMGEYSISQHITNAQLQSGTQMEWMTRINAAALANKIMDVVLAPMTVANYGAAVLTSAAAAFGPSDLATIWAGAKNYMIRNLILDGGHYARLMPTNTLGFALTNGSPNFGFDGIWYNNRWDGAGANVIGIVCDPQALIVAAGLPIDPPGANSQFSSLSSTVMPELGVSVQTATWLKPGTRVAWMAYDLMLGVSANDTTAAEVITSA